MSVRFRFAIATVCLMLLSVSCDKDGLPPPSPGPVPAATVRIELVAPSEITPGGSAQLTVNAVKSDGTTENVSSQVLWVSSSDAVLTISNTGMAKAESRGEAIVSARHGSRAATARIFVLPSGTFALKGVVRELGFPVANVSVAVLSGEGQGLSVQSQEDGSYALYGVGGSVRLSLKKTGYLDSVQEVRVTEHMTRDLDIAAERGRTDYRGTYTLTIAADSACKGFYGRPLPEASKRRVYTASVAQQDALLTVTLSDADLIIFNGRGNGFLGYIEPPNVIRFKISDVNWDFYGYYATGGYDIAERVEGRAMMFSGVATVTGTPARLSGVFQGALALAFHATPPLQPLAGGCESGHHFEMVRK